MDSMSVASLAVISWLVLLGVIILVFVWRHRHDGGKWCDGCNPDNCRGCGGQLKHLREVEEKIDWPKSWSHYPVDKRVTPKPVSIVKQLVEDDCEFMGGSRHEVHEDRSH